MMAMSIPAMMAMSIPAMMAMSIPAMMAMSIPAMHCNVMTLSHQLCSLLHNVVCLVDASGGSHLNDGKA